MGNRIKNIIFIAAAAVLIAAAGLAVLYGAFPTPYLETVDKYAEEYGVDRSLIYAVIKAESNFDPAAVSRAGAKGLAQLTDETAEYVAGMIGEEYNSGDSFKAEHNIRLAAYYLKYLLDKYNGDLVCTVAAYNAGEGNVDKWLKSNGNIDTIPFGETERYVKKVKIYRRIYSALYK